MLSPYLEVGLAPSFSMAKFASRTCDDPNASSYSFRFLDLLSVALLLLKLFDVAVLPLQLLFLLPPVVLKAAWSASSRSSDEPSRSALLRPCFFLALNVFLRSSSVDALGNRDLNWFRALYL